MVTNVKSAQQYVKFISIVGQPDVSPKDLVWGRIMCLLQVSVLNSILELDA
jgi:hypothetical protein